MMLKRGIDIWMSKKNVVVTKQNNVLRKNIKI